MYEAEVAFIEFFVTLLDTSLALPLALSGDEGSVDSMSVILLVPATGSLLWPAGGGVANCGRLAPAAVKKEKRPSDSIRRPPKQLGAASPPRPAFIHHCTLLLSPSLPAFSVSSLLLSSLQPFWYFCFLFLAFLARAVFSLRAVVLWRVSSDGSLESRSPAPCRWCVGVFWGLGGLW